MSCPCVLVGVGYVEAAYVFTHLLVQPLSALGSGLGLDNDEPSLKAKMIKWKNALCRKASRQFMEKSSCLCLILRTSGSPDLQAGLETYLKCVQRLTFLVTSRMTSEASAGLRRLAGCLCVKPHPFHVTLYTRSRSWAVRC